MNKKTFEKLTEKKIVILDGSTGTMLQKRGMPAGVNPEKWILENPEALLRLQKEYIASGADIIYTPTLGCNYFKLMDFGLEKGAFDLNKKLAQLSRKAAGLKGLVAGNISSTGKLIRPSGDIDFDLAVERYKEQVKGLLAGRVDLFAIETMMDLQEARAALLAVKETCSLPVMVCMTFEKNGRTLTGSDPVSALITLQSLGADAVGVNCSTGPEDMLLVVSAMKPYAKVPLLAKPNAGLPELVDNKTLFRMTPEQFNKYVPEFIRSGVNLFGGCCGTSPDFIRLVSKTAKGKKPKKPAIRSISALSSIRRTVLLDQEKPVILIGERINPTGKKVLQEELKQGLMQEVRRYSREQEEQGAAVLDVNVGMPGINEKELLLKVSEFLTRSTELPLCFDSSSVEALETVLRQYPGRALINSISLEKQKISRLLPVAAKYGAMFVLLPLDDREIPETAQARIRIIKQVFQKAVKYGYTKDDILVDGLVMSVSSNSRAGLETLKVIEWCKRSFKVRTVVGLSNISFGLPERETVNAAFLALAVSKGLSTAIANPGHHLLMSVKTAADLLLGKDRDARGYLRFFSGKKKDPADQLIRQPALSPGELIYKAVVEGNKEKIIDLVKNGMETHLTPDDIINRFLIPAIQKVGDLFDRKEYFLPQLIMSAETMRTAFDHLLPWLEQGNKQIKNRKIILATVKGDVHDIGKNIVALMLRNYGFDVIDLGKNVEATVIINKALSTQADIIGLSALMTTTMVEMKKVIELGRHKGVKGRFVIGGAVVTDQYAKEIGASYARDAMEAVRLCEKV
ncbi:MAG: homocysteine S-methyltransferase family protein [bacterium]|nr:homocysteine S-methyltransferase family protein [bacterium]